jgi:hypothetical protein
VTSDASDNVYVVSTDGWGIKLDTGLTTEAFSKRLTGALYTESVLDIGHTGGDDGELITSGGGSFYGYDAAIERFDNNGDYISTYNVIDPSGDARQVHVLATAGGPGPNLGTCFTSELSSNPPGKVQAIATVKYVDGDVTSIFWNSCQTVEIDPTKWTAEHSVYGSFPVGLSGRWQYNSPL